MIREEVKKVSSGYLMIVVLGTAQIMFGYMLIASGLAQWIVGVLLAILASIIVIICWAGLFMVHPNKAKVLQLFGKYVGTVHDPGLKWANPFFTKTAVSTQIRNFESGQLKVDDSRGSPIEIAAVVVWKVFDTAEALFEVDDYEEFVQIQSESALRNLSTTYPYEPHEGEGTALRSHPAEMALEKLRESNIVDLDEERKAAMVSNLLVVLCGEEGVRPVVNTGSLYT